MNPVLRWISKRFEQGAASAQEFHAVTSNAPLDLDIFTDIPYQNHEDIPLAMDIYRLKNYGKEAMPIILPGRWGTCQVRRYPHEYNRKLCKRTFS